MVRSKVNQCGCSGYGQQSIIGVANCTANNHLIIVKVTVKLTSCVFSIARFPFLLMCVVNYYYFHFFSFQRGWDKWSANHPDWYARRSDAREPDWYTRRVNIVRGGDTTYLDWKWDQTSHPTYRRTFGMEDEPKRTGYIGYPDKSHQIEGQIPVPKWGLNHPPHYQDPNRVDAMTPVVL